MKTLKKYFKVVLCFMAFAVASFAFAFSPISPVFAATAEFAARMAMTQMPTKVDAQNEDLKIPYVSGAEIRVYDASGKEHKYTGTDDGYFTKDDSVVKVAKEKLVGSSNPYRIVYVKDKFYSKEFKVYVSDASYTLKLVEENNSRVLIPSKIAKNADARIDLPTRAVINDVESTSAVTVEVRKDGHFVVDYTLGTSPAGNDYVVEGKFVPKETGEYTIAYYANKCDVVKYSFEVEEGYVVPAKEDIIFEAPKVSGIELGKTEIPVVSNYQAERPLKITDTKGNDVPYNLKSIEIVNAGNENIKATLGYNTYVFDMTTTAFGATAYRDMVGTYNFVFTVEDVYGHTLTKTVEVKNVTDSTSPQVKMAYNYSVDADTKEVVGEVNTNVEADLKASVGYKELVLPAIYAEDYVSTNSDMKYVRFLTQTSTGKEFYVDNLVVRNYTIQHLEYVEEEVGDVTEKYFKNKDDANDKTHYNGNFALVTKEGNVYTTSYGEANKDVKVQFAEYDVDGHYSANDLGLYCGESGEYAIHYRAYRDVVNKTYGELTNKTIKVEASEKHTVGTTTPKVEVRTESSNVEKNSTIKVKTIAADENSEDVLKTSVYFKNFASKNDIDVAAIKTAANNALTAALADYYQDELWTNFGPCNILDSNAFKTAFAGYSAANNNLTADGEYEVELGENSGYYAVVALTINNDSHLGIAVKTLKVVDTTDVDEPSAAVAEWDNEQKVAQQTVVDMPDVAFSDNDDDLALSVAYYVGNPQGEVGYDFFAPSEYHYVGNKISGVKINADLVGTYYVVYTATDDAGNCTTVYYTFEAIQAADPVLTVSASGEDLTKSGNTITGKLTPSGLKVDFTPEMKSADGNYDYTEDEGGDETVTERFVGCEINANGVRVDDNGNFSYTLQSAGTVTFTFYGYVTYNIGDGVTCHAISKTFTVTAEVPTMAWTNENKLTQLETVAEKGQSIELPELVATHGAYGTTTSIKVEYIYNGKTEDVTDYIDKTDPTTPTPVLSGYTFIPHKDDGRYVVTYTAKSAYGTTITATHTFKLGDTYKPTFVVTGDSDLKKDISLAKDGTIKYNVSWSTSGNKSFKVTVDGKEYPLNVTIKDKNKSNVETDMAWTDLKVQLLKDGKVVSAVSGYNYEITEAGAYTLRLYITDNNANEGEYKINFNVVNAAEPSTKTDLALGIVLIVLSVVVLAGAIVFFIFAGRKGGKGKGKKNKSVEENSNTEDNSEAKSGDVE